MVSLSRIFTHTDSIVAVQLNSRVATSRQSRFWLMVTITAIRLLPQQRDLDGVALLVEVVVYAVILVLRNPLLYVLLDTEVG